MKVTIGKPTQHKNKKKWAEITDRLSEINEETALILEFESNNEAHKKIDNIRRAVKENSERLMSTLVRENFIYIQLRKVKK